MPTTMWRLYTWLILFNFYIKEKISIMSLKKSHPLLYFTFHSTIAIQVFEVGRSYNHWYFITNAKERPPCTVAHTNNQLPRSINNLN